MASPASATRTSPASIARVARFAWLTLAYNIGVILWGAYVRASGSGAGCGSHWPLCNGVMVPRAPSIATIVEFSHRLTSGLALIAVVTLLIAAFRATPKYHPARRGAALSLFFMLTEAAVGAGLVLFQLVADNASMARAMFMAVHLANTFLLLASLTLTAWWLSGGEEIETTGRPGLSAGLATLGVGIILVGVSGSVAALGDTLFPASSLAGALYADLSASSHILIRLRFLHPALALTVAFALMLVASRLTISVQRASSSPLRIDKLRQAVLVLPALQIVAGFVNVILLAPVWMQIIHLLLADAVWIAFVLLSAAALAPQSARSAVSGSTRVARHAGI